MNGLAAWSIKLNGAFRLVRSAYKPPRINCFVLYSIMQVKDLMESIKLIFDCNKIK